MTLLKILGIDRYTAKFKEWIRNKFIAKGELKTINNESIEGKGNIVIEGGSGGADSPVGYGDAEHSAVLKSEKEVLGVTYKNEALNEGCVSLGANSKAGKKGYYFTYIDFENKKIWVHDKQFTTKLLGWKKNSVTDSNRCLYKIGDNISIVCNGHYELFAKIIDVTDNVITIDQELPFTEEDVPTVINNIIDGVNNKFDECSVSAYYYNESTMMVERHNVGPVDLGGGAFAEGTNTYALGACSHAEGYNTQAIGKYSHAEGRETISFYGGHAEGIKTVAAEGAHAEGYETIAGGKYSHAEGHGSRATNEKSHAEGGHTLAEGWYSHAEGYKSYASATATHAEGYETTADGMYSHSEGYWTRAEGKSSHAEGAYLLYNDVDYGVALGENSHAEGQSRAEAKSSHSEGDATIARGKYSHSEGCETLARGESSHTEGYLTKAEGYQAHAEGKKTRAVGDNSHTEGLGTITYNSNEHASGEYNFSVESDSPSEATLYSIGIGTSEDERKNAFEVKKNGDIYIEGVEGRIQDKLNGGGSATPDWNAKEGEVGYIENRTHYETVDDKTIYQSVCGYGEIFGYDDIYGVEVGVDGFYDNDGREVEVRFTDGIEYYTDWYELYSIPTKLVFYGSGNNPDYGYGEITGDGYEDIRIVDRFRGWSGYTEALEISNPYNVGLVCEYREKPVVTPLDDKYIPDTIARKSDIPVPIIINYNTIKDAANSEVNTISEQTWLKYIANDTYKNYDWIIQRDGIKYNCTVIPDYDNEHIQILYFTRNEIEGTSGPLGNAIMKYSGLRIQLSPYTQNTYLIYKISNGGSLETREFVFGENYNTNAYLIAAAQMSGIDTIDCKWVYTEKADKTITVNGQYFHIENSITNVDAIFSVKDKSLTYVDGNGLINKVTFADNGSYAIIPDTVIKTTPQTLSDTDKNQALTNLGIDPVVWKYLANPYIIEKGNYLPDYLLQLLLNGNPLILNLCKIKVVTEMYDEIAGANRPYVQLCNPIASRWGDETVPYLSLECITFYNNTYHTYHADIDIYENGEVCDIYEITE